MKLDTNINSAFMLTYHMIFCVKHRKKIINNKISDRLKEIFLKIAPSYQITMEKWNHDKDYVHICIKGEPKTEMSKFINAYKSASSRLIKKEFPEIKEKLYEEIFWSKGFLLLTTGGETVNIIRKYIQTKVG